MKTFTIARDYEDEVGKPLRIFARFTRSKRLCHVGHRASATPFLTREDAEESCPRGYHVDPLANKKRAVRKEKAS